jgi:hypothetical protein
MSVCALVLATASGSACADMIPFTSAFARVIVGAAGIATSQDEQSPTNVDGPSSASVNRNATGIDGSTAEASSTAVANFGTLGVGGSGSGLAPPDSAIAGAASSVLAVAFWDDFLTATPNAGSLLAPGAPVTATFTLGLDFQNSLLALNNANGSFAYQLFASIAFTDPVTGIQSSQTLLDDCLVSSDEDFAKFCFGGAGRIDIPGNTNGELAIQLAPITLPLAILQPFELSVSLSFNGQCTAGPSDSADSTCTFDGNALHTSTTTLQPLGDFRLISASGHDYSLSLAPPSGSVPEPGSLALIVGAFLPAALSLRRRGKREPGVQPPSRNAG